VAGELPQFHRQAPRLEDALSGWNLTPEFEVVAIGFDIRFEAPRGDGPARRQALVGHTLIIPRAVTSSINQNLSGSIPLDGMRRS
jgi:hypothetical protein